MKQNILMLRIAGGLALFTALGHTAGTFMPVPPEQVEVAKAEAVLQSTLVPMAWQARDERFWSSRHVGCYPRFIRLISP